MRRWLRQTESQQRHDDDDVAMMMTSPFVFVFVSCPPNEKRAKRKCTPPRIPSHALLLVLCFTHEARAVVAVRNAPAVSCVRGSPYRATGKRNKKKERKKVNKPARTICLHRAGIVTCATLTYVQRARR